MADSTHTPADITNHEILEERRVQRAEADYRSREEAISVAYAREIRETEAAEKTKASAELQTFSAIEIPAILEAGERTRTEAVEAVEKSATAKLPAVLTQVLSKARTQTLSL